MQGGFLSGYKTYVLAAAAVVYGLAQWAVGDMGLTEALNYAWAGGVAAALRAGVAKVQ